jgi:hypothetical protein
VRTAKRLLLLFSLVLSAGRAGAVVKTEARQLLDRMEDDDTVEKTYAALGAQHYARRQWGFSLFSHAEQRPWQRELAPLVPHLIDMLALDEGLEWIDQSNGATTQTTTPRQEATRALAAMERASVEPLIAALDRPKLARKADDLLRAIVRGGPPDHDRAGWQRWWEAHRNKALPNERGQWWLLGIGALVVAGMGAVVFRLQRKT